MEIQYILLVLAILAAVIGALAYFDKKRKDAKKKIPFAPSSNSIDIPDPISLLSILDIELALERFQDALRESNNACALDVYTVDEGPFVCLYAGTVAGVRVDYEKLAWVFTYTEESRNRNGMSECRVSTGVRLRW